MRNEIAIRLSFFFASFIIISLWELIAPRRGLTTDKHIRWFSNLGIIF